MTARRTALSRVAILFSASALGVAGSWHGGAGRAAAATLTFDADGTTTADIVDGSGSWNTTAGNEVWRDGASNVVWTDLSDAVFGGTTGTPGTVTVTGAAVNVNSMTFNVGGYTIADTSATIRLIMPGTGGINANESATVTTFRAALMQRDTQTWTVAPGKSFTMDATPNGQFLVGGNTNLGKMLTLGGGGAVHFVAASTTFGLGVPQNSTLTINDATMTVTGRTSGALTDGISLVVRSRSDFNGPAGKAIVNTGGLIDLGTNFAAIQQNASGDPTFLATGPAGELHLDGGAIALAGFGNPAASTPLGSQGVVYVNGGEIRATMDNAQFIPAPWVSGVGGLGPQSLFVSAGGATINTNGFNVTSENPLIENPASTGGGFTKSGAGTLTVASNTYTGPTAATGGTLALGQSLTTSSAVSASNDATIELSSDGSSTRVISTGAVSIGANARIDLKDNKLITTSPAGTATGGTYDGVQGEVQRAHNAGAWNQPGLTTSMPDAVTGLTSIGVGTGARVLGLGPGETDTFAGQTVSDTSTIAMYTYRGDANMDGFISGDDYSAIDFAVATPGSSGWTNGDFNWDGIISGDDYSAIDFNLVAQGAPFPTGGAAAAGVSAVPEPATLAAPLLGAVAAFARRRRRP